MPRLVGFSSIAVSLGAVLTAVAVYLPAHLAGALGLNVTVIGVSWASVRLLDLFVDPVLGLIMDRTRTKFGRYRPWTLLGGPILALALWALFEARPGIGPGYLIAWLLVLYLGQSILTMGQSAWGANLAPDYNGRSRMFGAIGIATALGGVAVILVPVIATPVGLPANHTVQAMGWMMIVLTLSVVVVAAASTPEPLRLGAAKPFRWADIWALITKPDLLRLLLAQMSLTLGPGWMGALFLFYFASRGFTTAQTSILLLINLGAGIIGALGMSRLAMRVGKHWALIAAAIGTSSALAMLLFIPNGSLFAAAPIMLVLGAMIASFSVTTSAMLADVGDEVRLQRGTDQLTLIYALNAVANKIAWALCIGLSFPLLSVIGFNPAEGAINTPAALRGLAVVFLAGPIGFCLLGGLCVAGWRLSAQRHAEIRLRLFEIDAATSATTPAAAYLVEALEPHGGG